jgi:hypothetical protein
MEHLIETIRPYGMLLAGGLFGAGWWAWCDVLLRSSLVLHTKVSPLYCIPGIVATVAVILMAVISKEDTDGYIGYEDDGEQVGKAVHAEACSGSICSTSVCMQVCCRRHKPIATQHHWLVPIMKLHICTHACYAVSVIKGG